MAIEGSRSAENARAQRAAAKLDPVTLDTYVKSFPGRIRQHEVLARRSTLRIGGPADLYVIARSADDLYALVRRAQELAIPYLILGGESNMLISDRGVRGLAIGNQAMAWRSEPARADKVPIQAESGVKLARLARETARQGLGGFEWAEGIPGTIGGGVITNAGAFGGCLGDSLVWADVLTADGNRRRWPAVELELDYRTSRFRHASQDVVLAAELELIPGDSIELEANVQRFDAQRRSHQPIGQSVGSMFKNPPGTASGYLIEQVGLKGHQIGGAQISTKHANFFLNVGGATSADVMALVAVARRRVREQFGIELELEVALVGDWTEGDDG